MAEAAEGKLTELLQSELKKLDKDCMRTLLVEGFRCSIKCCEDRLSSSEVVQRCVAGCQQPHSQVEEKIKDEINQIQDRLTRCAQQCSDEFKDGVSVVGQEAAQGKAEQCLVKCCDKHSKLVPKIFATLRGSIKTCS